MIRIKGAGVDYLIEYMTTAPGTYLDSDVYEKPEYGGKMAAHFGMNGPYEREHFIRAINGQYKIDGATEYADLRYHTSGEKLNADGGAETTDAAIELLLSPPKSWSIAAYFSEDSNKGLIHSVLREAKKEALSRFEDMITVRVTEDKVTRHEHVKGLVYTSFKHDTTRRGDVDLHDHVIVNKQALCMDGKIRTLDISSAMKMQYELDAYFKHALFRIGAEAGLKIESTANGPELAQISLGARRAFSTAREEMRQLMEDNGFDIESSTESSRLIANLQTRMGKVTHDPDFVHKMYLTKLETAGVNPASLRVKAGKPTSIKPDVDAAAAVTAAIAEIMERKDVIRSKHYLILTASKHAAFKLSPALIADEIDRQITAGIIIKRVPVSTSGRVNSESTSLTTTEALQREKVAARLYRKSRGRGRSVCTAAEAGDAISQIEHDISASSGSTVALTAGQKDMIHAALGITSQSAIVAVQGDPGTGKTTGMQAVRIAAERAGWKVRGLAPSDQAREALAAAGIDTETVQFASKSASYFKEIDEKSIVIIDEAGMVDSRTLNRLLQECRARGARVVPVGDTKQLESVESGKPFYRIVEEAALGGDLTSLTEMARGRTAEMRALHDLSRDDQAAALKLLMDGKAAGQAHFFEKKSEQYAHVATFFAGLSAEDRYKHPIVVDTNGDRLNVNKAVREALAMQTVFECKSFAVDNAVTRAEHALASSYEAGRFVKFNRAGTGFGRGDVCKIISNEAGKIFVETKAGPALFDVESLGARVSIGDLDTVQIGKGELLRVAAKWEKMGLRNGDRLKITEIDAKGLAMADVIDFDGRASKTVKVDLATAGISIRHGYSSTVHGLQGASIDHGTYLAANTSRNSFLVGVTRFRHSVRLVSGAITNTQIEALAERAQRERTKESAEIDPKEIQKLYGKILSNAAWHGKSGFQPYPANRIKDAEEVKLFINKALNERIPGENLTITGTQEFIAQTAREYAKRALAALRKGESFADDVRFGPTIKDAAKPHAAKAVKEDKTSTVIAIPAELSKKSVSAFLREVQAHERAGSKVQIGGSMAFAESCKAVAKEEGIRINAEINSGAAPAKALSNDDLALRHAI